MVEIKTDSIEPTKTIDTYFSFASGEIYGL